MKAGIVDGDHPHAQIGAMKELSKAELAEIGREAARYVAELGEVQEVEAAAGLDSADEPAYFFNFLIDRGQDSGSRARALTRLSQSVRDRLMERGDERYPFVRILGLEGWAKRGRA